MTTTNDDAIPPPACTLPEAEFQRRTIEIRQDIARRVTATYELKEGLAFCLPLTDASLAEAEAFVELEQRCCGFADFAIRRDEPNSSLWVEIRGPQDTKAFFRRCGR